MGLRATDVKPLWGAMPREEKDRRAEVARQLSRETTDNG